MERQTKEITVRVPVLPSWMQTRDEAYEVALKKADAEHTIFTSKSMRKRGDEWLVTFEVYAS